MEKLNFILFTERKKQIQNLKTENKSGRKKVWQNCENKNSSSLWGEKNENKNKSYGRK
jgi:hypothetical protein